MITDERLKEKIENTKQLMRTASSSQRRIYFDEDLEVYLELLSLRQNDKKPNKLEGE